jgi:hypothetical protein
VVGLWELPRAGCWGSPVSSHPPGSWGPHLEPKGPSLLLPTPAAASSKLWSAPSPLCTFCLFPVTCSHPPLAASYPGEVHET